MIEIDLYKKELNNFIKENDISIFKGSNLLITGGTGLICSYLIDVILESKCDCSITLLCRDKNKASERFQSKKINYIECDLMKPIVIDKQFDYILSGASYTDPKNYGKYPVETININVIGAYNLFEFAKTQKKLKKFFIFSSCEVYGEETSLLCENTKGIVDCLNVRSCYNESKRLIETMAISYYKEYGIKTIIGRFSRVYGPTIKRSDTKALSQFIFNALNNEDIILKSDGTQMFSYCYVSDAVSAIMILLEKGDVANAYNITNDKDVLMLRDIAKIIASYVNKDVIFENVSKEEINSYSKATIAIQDCSKIRKLGWIPKVYLEEGIKNTIKVLKIMQDLIKQDGIKL